MPAAQGAPKASEGCGSKFSAQRAPKLRRRRPSSSAMPTGRHRHPRRHQQRDEVTDAFRRIAQQTPGIPAFRHQPQKALLGGKPLRQAHRVQNREGTFPRLIGSRRHRWHRDEIAGLCHTRKSPPCKGMTRCSCHLPESPAGGHYQCISRARPPVDGAVTTLVTLSAIHHARGQVAMHRTRHATSGMPSRPPGGMPGLPSASRQRMPSGRHRRRAIRNTAAP